MRLEARAAKNPTLAVAAAQPLEAGQERCWVANGLLALM